MLQSSFLINNGPIYIFIDDVDKVLDIYSQPFGVVNLVFVAGFYLVAGIIKGQCPLFHLVQLANLPINIGSVFLE